MTVIEHAVVPLVIVTAALAEGMAVAVEQPPATVIVGTAPEFVVVDTVKLLLYAAGGSAPVRVTVAVGVIEVASTVCVNVAAEKFEPLKNAPAQDAVNVQVPLPLSIVTVAEILSDVPLNAPTSQTPAVPVITGVTPEFVVAATLNVALYAAVAGAPVNVTAGVTVPSCTVAEADDIGCVWKMPLSGDCGKKLSVASTR